MSAQRRKIEVDKPWTVVEQNERMGAKWIKRPIGDGVASSG